MDNWCGVGESIAVSSDGPSICFCYTITSPLPSLLFLIVSWCRFYDVRRYRKFENLDPRTSRFLWLSVFLSILEAICVIGFSIDDELSLSLLYSSTIQAIAWVTAAFLTVLECYRLTHWPCSVVKAFFVLNLLVVMLATLTHRSNGASPQHVAESSVLLAVNVCIAALAFLKDFCLKPEELTKLELDRMSVVEGDFNFSARKKSATDGMFSLSWWSRRATTSHDSQGDDAKEPFLQKPGLDIWKYRGSASVGDRKEFTYLITDEVLEDGSRSNSRVSSLDSQATCSDQSFVRSVLEKHSGYGEEEAQPAMSGGPLGVLRHLARRISGDSERSLETLQAATDPQLPRRKPSRASSDDIPGSSPALERALRVQRDKLAQTDPGLAPRGASAQGSRNRVSNRSTSAGSDSHHPLNSSQLHDHWVVSVLRWGMRRPRGYSSSTDRNQQGQSISAQLIEDMKGITERNSMLGGTTSRISLLQRLAAQEEGDERPSFMSSASTVVVVGQSHQNRLGAIRDNSELGLVYSESSSDDDDDDENEVGVPGQAVLPASSAAEPSAGTEDGSERNSSIMEEHAGVDDSGTRRIGGLEGEVEFEISLRVASGEDSWEVEKAIRSNNNKGRTGLKKWTAWRTASELSLLHSQMLSIFGDMAPRKPPMKTTVPTSGAGVGGTYAVLQSDIKADMRTISVFVTALLRSSLFLSMPAVRNFMNLDESDIPPRLRSTANNDEGAESSELSTFTSPRLDNNASLGFLSSRDSIFDSIPGTPRSTEEDIPVSPNASSLFALDLMAAAASAQSQGMASAEAKVGSTNNQQDKWRKVFLNMRVKLKPHDIAIRTRLFVGVISGAEVSTWLMKHYCSELVAAALENDAQSSDQPKPAQDRSEACAIGQELVRCGLLVAVCCGNKNDAISQAAAEEDRVAEFGTLQSTIHDDASAGASTGKKDATETPAAMAIFSDYPYYIYRFPARSATAGGVGSFTLFGAPVVATIPQWAYFEDNEELKSSRETISLVPATAVRGPLRSSLMGVGAQLTGSATGGSHVEYLVVIKHAEEEWEIWKRFSEFKAWNRLLTKEGVRPEVSFPSFSTFGLSTQAVHESRRIKLETFLNSALEAVVNSGSEVALHASAAFVDDDFFHLRIV